MPRSHSLSLPPPTHTLTHTPTHSHTSHTLPHSHTHSHTNHTLPHTITNIHRHWQFLFSCPHCLPPPGSLSTAPSSPSSDILSIRCLSPLYDCSNPHSTEFNCIHPLFNYVSHPFTNLSPILFPLPYSPPLLSFSIPSLFLFLSLSLFSLSQYRHRHTHTERERVR